jgi:hypothetical protein
VHIRPVRHHRAVRPVVPPEPTAVCPGCCSVLVTMPGEAHPGASASCTRLFETTLRGLREESAADAGAAATVALADAAYDAQHPVPGDPARAADAVARLAGVFGADGGTPGTAAPPVWRTTIADVAADLDVIDLPALVEAWARAVHRDWCGEPAER